jgi:hypothetical protein
MPICTFNDFKDPKRFLQHWHTLEWGEPLLFTGSAPTHCLHLLLWRLCGHFARFFLSESPPPPSPPTPSPHCVRRCFPPPSLVSDTPTSACHGGSQSLDSRTASTACPSRTSASVWPFVSLSLGCIGCREEVLGTISFVKEKEQVLKYLTSNFLVPEARRARVGWRRGDPRLRRGHPRPTAWPCI